MVKYLSIYPSVISMTSGPLFTKKTVCLIGIGISIINLRQSSVRLMFKMGIPIHVYGVFFVNKSAELFTGTGAISQ